MDKPHKIEQGVYMAPIILPDSMQHRKEEFEEILKNAQRKLMEFARNNGWENHMEESYFDRFEIYDVKEEFNKRILEITGQTVEEALKSSSVDDDKIPDTFSAGLENRILFTVSPELFAKNIPSAVEDDYFLKILSHEIAHRLHIRILNGNEDAMGPIWFYEGFAMFAANQFRHNLTDMSKEEIWEIVRGTKRISYYKYNSVFRYFLKKASLHELVKKAGENGFLQWLEEIDNKPEPKKFNYVF